MLYKNNVVGLDEAGRGSVLGPLVLATVQANKSQLQQLQKLAIKDSKKFGAGQTAVHKRHQLAANIKLICNTQIVAKDSWEVDHYVKTYSLNFLEQEVAKQLLAVLNYDMAILDGYKIFQPLTVSNSKLICLDKADTNHDIVAAASIVAKDARDQLLLVEMAKISNKLSEKYYKGMGYPNQGTFDFVSSYYEKHESLPNNYRKSYNWKKLNIWLKDFNKKNI